MIRRSCCYAIVVLFTFAGMSNATAWPWTVTPQEKALQSKANSVFSKVGSDCFNISTHSKVLSTGTARSPERLKSVNDFYTSLVSNTCLTNWEKKIYVNPFYQSNFSKLDKASVGTSEFDLWLGILNDVDYGFTPFTKNGTICSDGTMSSSVGRGTCSWHGGYASARGKQLPWESYLDLYLKPSTTSYSKLSQFGIFWETGYPSEPFAPVDNVKSSILGFTCTSSSQIEGVSCFHFPYFAFRFCTTSKLGNLEMQLGSIWKQGWTVHGFKILNNCPNASPYLFEIVGKSYVDGNFRVLLSDKSKVDFRLVTKPF